MLAENLARVYGVKAAGIIRGEKFPPFARVECGAVRRDGDNEVIRAELEMLCNFDRRDEIRDAGEPEILQPGDRLRPDMPTFGEVIPPGLAVEQEIERRCAAVRYADHNVGIHD